jgi:hypothetical protein
MFLRRAVLHGVSSAYGCLGKASAGEARGTDLWVVLTPQNQPAQSGNNALPLLPFQNRLISLAFLGKSDKNDWTISKKTLIKLNQLTLFTLVQTEA